MFGKLYASTYTGSMLGSGANVFAVWGYCIANADRTGSVELNHQLIAFKLGMTVDEVTAAIDFLGAPDTNSRSARDEGRRLIRTGQFMYRLPNYDDYRNIKTADDRREQNRLAQHRHREKYTNKPVSSRKSQKSAHAEVEVEVDAEVEKNPSALARHNVPRDTNVPDWFLDFKLAYPERAGGQGWRKAMRSAAARLAEGHAPSELIAGAQRYAAYVDGTGKRGTEYVKQAATFLGPDKHFLEPWTLPLGKADIQQNANLTASLQWLEQSNETR